MNLKRFAFTVRENMEGIKLKEILGIRAKKMAAFSNTERVNSQEYNEREEKRE